MPNVFGGEGGREGAMTTKEALRGYYKNLAAVHALVDRVQVDLGVAQLNAKTPRTVIGVLAQALESLEETASLWNGISACEFAEHHVIREPSADDLQKPGGTELRKSYPWPLTKGGNCHYCKTCGMFTNGGCFNTGHQIVNGCCTECGQTGGLK